MKYLNADWYLLIILKTSVPLHLLYSNTVNQNSSNCYATLLRLVIVYFYSLTLLNQNQFNSSRLY